MQKQLSIAASLLVFALACNSRPSSTVSKADPAEIYGTWVEVSGKFLGKSFPERSAGRMRLTFTEDKIIWEFVVPPEETWKSWEGAYRLDPSHEPKEIDLTPPNNRTDFRPGIYKIEGDTLTILFGSERPKDFDQQAPARLEFKRK
jgi:uncharacterized protein (TIGR03067 family)